MCALKVLRTVVGSWVARYGMWCFVCSIHWKSCKPGWSNELCEESMQCRTSFGFTELVLLASWHGETFILGCLSLWVIMCSQSYLKTWMNMSCSPCFYSRYIRTYIGTYMWWSSAADCRTRITCGVTAAVCTLSVCVHITIDIGMILCTMRQSFAE